jgi:ADP-heptose:LPS heptosyltransferase
VFGETQPSGAIGLILEADKLFNMVRNLILQCRLSPGDVLAMTAAVESLHASYPGQYQTDVRTSVKEIWEHNPRIAPLADGEGELLDLHYPTIQRCNQAPHSFLAGYTRNLSELLGVPLELTTNRPHLYLSEEEKEWINQIRHHFTNNRVVPFWLVNAGVKNDYTTKQWPVENYQEVIDATRGRTQWVQIGATEHSHPRLRGVIDLIGKTDQRQLIRLAYHAEGGLGPVTYLQHLTAAWEKSYVCLLGGREPVTWVQYPRQITLHTIGQLTCCRSAACWRSRVMPLGDGGEQDGNLCDQPILGLERPVGRCMASIRPSEVLAVIERWLALR